LPVAETQTSTFRAERGEKSGNALSKNRKKESCSYNPALKSRKKQTIPSGREKGERGPGLRLDTGKKAYSTQKQKGISETFWEGGENALRIHFLAGKKGGGG